MGGCGGREAGAGRSPTHPTSPGEKGVAAAQPLLRTHTQWGALSVVFFLPLPIPFPLRLLLNRG